MSGVEKITFRPVERWPAQVGLDDDVLGVEHGELTFQEVPGSPLARLELGAPRVNGLLVEDQIRLDGWPRSGVTPARPGVIIAFNSRFGPLQYATDTFDRYLDNIRAIALGLEALRAVDRYGVTKRGEQYTGWRALPAGPADDESVRGKELIEQHGSVRAALIATHPDRGGDVDDFRAVQAARDDR